VGVLAVPAVVRVVRPTSYWGDGAGRVDLLELAPETLGSNLASSSRSRYWTDWTLMPPMAERSAEDVVAAYGGSVCPQLGLLSSDGRIGIAGSARQPTRVERRGIATWLTVSPCAIARRRVQKMNRRSACHRHLRRDLRG
jgi:hypothetical protein